MTIVYIITAISAVIGAFIAVDDLKDAHRPSGRKTKDCPNGCK